MELVLSILTLNCWGIPVISKDRHIRMLAIAQAFQDNLYDIICLQEVWSDSDYNLIKDKVRTVLPNSHYYYSGVVGSGICIFSKYPFQEVFFHQWPVNGYIHKLHHGDWFGGKGVGLCRLRINSFDVNIYSAHLHAEYDRSCDEYVAHRVLQAFDTAQFIKLTSSSADLIVLAGDLNTEPNDLAYRILLATTGLTDSFTAADNKHTFSDTNEHSANSYTSCQNSTNVKGKRIDYIMYRTASNLRVTHLTYSHPLPERLPKHNISYSDHEAVAATLHVNPVISEHRPNIDNSVETVLNESVNVFDMALMRLREHRRFYWFCTSFLFLMLVLTIGMDAPYNYTKMYHTIRAVVTGVLCFTLIMATLWNSIEYNAILAGKLNMEVSLRNSNLLILMSSSTRFDHNGYIQDGNIGDNSSLTCREQLKYYLFMVETR